MEINWTTTAERHLENTEKYLWENFSIDEIDFLHDEIERVVENIVSGMVEHPTYEGMEGVKKVIVAKYNTLVYEKNNDVINILGLLSHRRLPANNYKEIANNKERLE